MPVDIFTSFGALDLQLCFFQRDKGSVHLHSLSELLVPNSRNGTTRWARLQFSGGRTEKKKGNLQYLRREHCNSYITPQFAISPWKIF